MPLMGALYVGASGLQTSQNALNTTAHNLANIDTTGYTRQQVLQGNRHLDNIGESYNNKLQVGLGVAYTDVRAVRDEFLDLQYRKESGRSAYYSTNYEVIQEINTLFGETEGAEFQTSLQNLRDALENLAKSPSDGTVQAALVNTASQFLDRANAVYTDLSTYQQNLNQQIIDKVDKINEYANQIAELNYKISSYEVAGIESPNDMRDARDQLLDELSSYGRIDYKEDLQGRVEVYFEGVNLVKHSDTNPMAAVVLEGDEATRFVTPVWSMYDNQKVFNTSQAINADIGSDSGSLKALYFTRGYKNGTWRDVQEGVYSGDKANYNGGKITEDLKDKDGNVIEQAQDHTSKYGTYDEFVGPAGFSISEIQAEFDDLIHNIVTAINDLLTENNSNGSPELFQRTTIHKIDSNSGELVLVTSDQYKDFMNDSSRIGKTCEWIEDMEKDDLSTYTTANIMINKDLLRQPSLLSDVGNGGFVKDDMTTDYEKAKKLADLFSTDKTNLNPDTITELTYENFYIDLVNQYADRGNTNKSLAESQEASVLAIENGRQQVVGVSDNEEMTKLIRFQNAYNASSRYINTVNSMLDTLLTSLT